MKIRNKRIWMMVAVAVVVIAGVIAALMWDSARRGPPQIIKMSSGVYHLAGVTYGTNHVMGSLAARVLHRLPASVEDFAQKHFGKWPGPLVVYKTEVPSLCVWFEPMGTNATFNSRGYGIGYSKLIDDHEIEAGTRYFSSSPQAGQPLGVFEVVPRRTPVLQFSFSEHDSQGEAREVGRVRFPNPLFGHYSVWQPEPVPVVKRAGDLEVRLQSFRSDFQPIESPPRMRGFIMWGTEGVETWFFVSTSSSTGTNQGWVMQSATLSDPTGNFLASHSSAGRRTDGISFGLTPLDDPGGPEWGRRHGNGNYLTPFEDEGKLRKMSGTLWPNEAAWRLKLEFKHMAGFAPAELVTFENVTVPLVGTTNNTRMTRIVNGVKLVLTQFVRNGAGTNSSHYFQLETQIRAELPDRNEGWAVEFVKLTTDSGVQPQILFNGWGPYWRSVNLTAIPTNASTVNITWAVQKMRSVEFFVKPPKLEGQ